MKRRDNFLSVTTRVDVDKDKAIRDPNHPV
jgi:hypothetical protein